MSVGKRYREAFAKCQREGRKAFIPFVVLGVPDLDTSLVWAEKLVEAGADALELGVPFSDPVADGPIIQKAYRLALQGGVQKRDMLSAIATLRAKFPALPLGILAYANLMMIPSVEENYRLLGEVDVDSVLLADVPVHAGSKFAEMASEHDLSQVFIASPTSSTERLKRIAQQCSAYVYVVSRQGVTGTQTKAGCPEAVLPVLKEQGGVPAVLGFGIDGFQAAREASEAGFDGVVVGSLLVEQQLRALEGWPAAEAAVHNIRQGLLSGGTDDGL